MTAESFVAQDNLIKPTLLGMLMGERWALKIEDHQVTILQDGRAPISTHLQAGELKISSDVLGYRVQFPGAAGQPSLHYVPESVAMDLLHLYRDTITSHATERIQQLSRKAVMAWEQTCGELFSKWRFITQHEYAQARLEYEGLMKPLVSEAQQILECVEGERPSIPWLESWEAHKASPGVYRDSHNAALLKKQLAKYTPLFQRAGLNLTEEQAFAAMSMDKANLLEAGAGSGKTVVLVARALYAVAEGIAEPSEVVCLAFNADAAKEIRERLNHAFENAGYDGAGDIQVKTFHALGLDILKATVHSQEGVSTCPPSDPRWNHHFQDALDATLTFSLHHDTVTALLNDLAYHDHQGRKLKDNVGELKKLLIERLKEAVQAFNGSEAYFRRAEPDRDMVTSPDVWGLTVERARKLQGFTPLVADINRRFRERLHAAHLVDFSDMTVKACAVLDSVAKGKNPSWRLASPLAGRFIMVDEYQDIAFDRAQLVLKLAQLHPDSIIFVVGDDWQAINRFAGSDLSLFTNFEKLFGRAERLQLTRTFRSSRGIAECSRQFVVRNKAQSSKPVREVANERIKGTLFRIDYRDRKDARFQLERIIEKWVREHQGEAPTVYLLDRNSSNKSLVLKREEFEQLKSHFKGRAELKLSNIHRSKGLQADYVVVMGLVEGRFPSTLPSRFWSDLYAPREETTIAHADERRLFYVATTRAKHEVALLVPEKEPSKFVGEIERIYRQLVENPP